MRIEINYTGEDDEGVRFIDVTDNKIGRILLQTQATPLYGITLLYCRFDEAGNEIARSIIPISR